MGGYALRFGYGCHGNRKVSLQAGCNTLVYRLHYQTLRTGCYKYNPSGYKRTSSFICIVPAPWIISIPTRRKCVAHLIWETCVLLPLRLFSRRERNRGYFWITFKSCGVVGWQFLAYRILPSQQHSFISHKTWIFNNVDLRTWDLIFFLITSPDHC
jgi:hypothetical protein